jgi:hypothetical protein
MRKLTGVLCAAVVVLPVPFVAEPAAAAGGVSCTSLAGTEVWDPPLPKRHSDRKAKPTITIKNAKLAGCSNSGGQIKRGSFTATFKWLDRGNCDTLLTYTPGQLDPRIKGTVTIRWNTGKTSTIAASLRKTKPYVQKINGKVVGGKFTGSKFALHLLIDPPKGACDTKPLSTTPFDGLTKLEIK